MIEPNFDMDDRAFWRRAVIKTLGVLGLILGALILAIVFVIYNVNAAPVAEAVGNGVVVTLYDEPCSVGAVSNLKQRATWNEKGTVFEGCWGNAQGTVLMYFERDRSVVALPAGVFARVSNV